MPPTPRSRTAAALVVLACLAPLAACSGEEVAVTPRTPTAPVIQPGRPGEPNATLTGSAAASAPTPTAYPADTRFVQEMIVHHAQAVVMVDAVTGDLRDPQVAAIAARIGAEQRPEIAAMASWLQLRGQDVPPEAANPNLTDHGAHSMPGMATEAEVQRLAGLSGAAADALFLELMIRHHRGALAMVDAYAPQSRDVQTEKLAAEIAVTQGKQIDQMGEMLQRLT